MELWIIFFSFFLWILTMLIEGKYVFLRLKKEKGKNVEKISLYENFLENGVSPVSGVVVLLVIFLSKISSNKEFFYFVLYGYFFFSLYLIFWYGLELLKERKNFKRGQEN